VAAGQVDDGQSSEAEPYPAIEEEPLVVGAAMAHRLRHASQEGGVWARAAKLDAAGDAAHGLVPLPGGREDFLLIQGAMGEEEAGEPGARAKDTRAQVSAGMLPEVLPRLEARGNRLVAPQVA
jgi:hypothetical protein